MKSSADNSSDFASSMQLCRPLAVDVSPNITIIGAGLIGLCTADALVSRGAKVTIMDARPGPCEGTSFSNSGMIHPSQALTWDTSSPSALELDAARVTVELGKKSRRILLELMERLGLPERESGCVQLYDELDGARRAQDCYNDIDIRANIMIDPRHTFGKTACYFPDDSSGDARVFGCKLAEDLASRGVKFIYGVSSLDFRQTQNGFNIRTPQMTARADHLILAAGFQTPELLSKVEIRMQLKAVSGAAADFALPEQKDNLPSYPLMDIRSRSALTVFEDRLRISGGWGLTDPASLIDRWREIAPNLMSRLASPISTWTGQRPVSPAGRPYISATSMKGLWVNTGHGHMGWTLCAGSGALLSEMILDGRDDRRFKFSG